MGSIISQMCEFFVKVWRLIFEGKEKRALMLGLDASGKTSILYKLKLGEIITTLPTIGFNCETVRYNNTSFILWDVGGVPKIRCLWRHYYQGSDGLIFVVDSNDRERAGEASDELWQVLNSEEVKNLPLLIFANKQDLYEAMKVNEIVEKFKLNDIKDREWFVQGSCAITGEGLCDGLEWLGSVFKTQRKKQLLEAYRRMQQIN